MSDATSLHRALSDERRARIVDELRSSAAGLDAESLAQRVGLHANTVRWHLGVLARAGLVRSAAAPRGTPGRPRILYTLVEEGLEPGAGDHRLLAAILTEVVARAPDHAAESERAGRAWGKALVRQEDAGDAPDPLGRVVAMLAEQGFEPEVAGDELRMHRCPFHALAETAPDVVCAVHAGMISGALEQLGAGLDVTDLDILVEPDTCVAHLGRRVRADAA